MGISSESTGTGIIFWGTIVLLFLVFSSAYTRYIFAKDYDFIVEVPCNSKTDLCFSRNCDDYCPPNNLEVYKTYIISAKDYEKCGAEGCQNFCGTKGQQICKEVVCDPRGEDICLGE